MRNRQIRLFREGVPLDLMLMREMRWTPQQLAQVDNRTCMELLALIRAEREVEARGN